MSGKVWFYDYPVGRVGIAERDGSISHLFFGADKSPLSLEAAETELIKQAARQLDEYFAGGRMAFDLPLAPQGTDFQKAVWNALLLIPAGQTRSYKEIAVAVGRPGACRAVGMANNRNPIAIIIPCHRVVGSDGGLVGYGGGLGVKRYLLELEGRQ